MDTSPQPGQTPQREEGGEPGQQAINAKQLHKITPPSGETDAEIFQENWEILGTSFLGTPVYDSPQSAKGANGPDQAATVLGVAPERVAHVLELPDITVGGTEIPKKNFLMMFPDGNAITFNLFPKSYQSVLARMRSGDFFSRSSDDLYSRIVRNGSIGGFLITDLSNPDITEEQRESIMEQAFEESAKEVERRRKAGEATQKATAHLVAKLSGLIKGDDTEQSNG